MPVIKPRKRNEAEERIEKAINHYQDSDELSIRALAEKHGVPYLTLRGRLQGRVTREIGHQKMLVLTEYEEKSIVRWCERLDEWGHPVRLGMVKGMAEAIVSRRINGRKLGMNWVTRFLNHHHSLATKLSTHLHRQRVLASNPVVLKDYFSKVWSLWYTK